MAKIPDLAHALSFLDKLNNVSVDGKNISSYFLWREYNLWHFYQSVLFRDIQKFDRNLIKESRENISWRGLFSGAILFFVSFLKFALSLLINPKVIIYGIDKYTPTYGSDPRMDDLYNFLSSKKVKYLEFLHSVSGALARSNLRKRKRGAIYVEAFDFIYNFLSLIFFVDKSKISFIERVDLSVFTDDLERKFAKQLILKYAKLRSVSIFKIRWYERIFKIISPKLIILIDDGRYHYYELLLAAKLSGVESIAIQHGQFNKYFLVGWLDVPSFVGKYVSPDRYYLWSDYWKQELIAMGTFIPKNNLIVAGYPEKALPKPISKTKENADENLYVVLPYETSAPRNEIIYYVREIMRCDGVKLIFKLRPGGDKLSQIKEYSFTDEEIKNILIVEKIDDYFGKNLLAVGCYSTFLYEMVLREVPTAILDTPYDHAEGMIRNGLAMLIRKDDNMCQKLMEMVNLDKAERDRRRQILGVPNKESLSQTIIKTGEEFGI